jgi:hypothetical protein
MKRVKVLTNQSIFDLALQEYGSIEGVIPLMLDNISLIPDLNSGIEAGELVFIKSTVLDENIVAQLKIIARARPEATNAHLATWPPYEPPQLEHLILTESGEPILTETQLPLQTEF